MGVGVDFAELLGDLVPDSGVQDVFHDVSRLVDVVRLDAYFVDKVRFPQAVGADQVGGGAFRRWA